MIKLIKKKMFEMAFSKAKYQDKITDRVQQIAHNWVLCTYCHLYNPTFLTYCHWKGELFDLLDYLNNLVIENKNNKYKWSLEALTKQAEYNKPQNVIRACRNKFRIEKELNVPTDKQIEICTLFSESLGEIASCLASDSGALDYVNAKFPEVTIGE